MPTRRQRTVRLVVLAATAVLTLQTLLVPQLQPWDAVDPATEGDRNGDDAEAEEGGEMLSVAKETELADRFHRILLGDDMDNDEDAEVLAIPGEDVKGGGNNVVEPLVTPFSQLIAAHQPLPPYTIRDAVDSSRMYDHTFSLLVYNPDDDRFHLVLFRRHYWVSACDKMITSFKYLAFFLRSQFPERFQGTNSDELVIPISSGDYPAVKINCLDHFRHMANNPLVAPGWRKLMQTKCAYNAAPILHFGSVFRQPHLFPSMVAMPMPDPHHLYCFEALVLRGEVCLYNRSTSEKGVLVFGEELGLAWEDLIPQVVWRGTDFSYLIKVHPFLHRPAFREDLVKWPWYQSNEDRETKRIGGELTANTATRRQKRLEGVKKRAPLKGLRLEQQLKHFSKAAAVKAMKDQYESLVPRWKAVVLTAEAEVQEEGPVRKLDKLPWANMKFSSYINGGSKTQIQGAEVYKEWEEVGFATGEDMDLGRLAQYKYHIDLGGGGGTTWSGTIQKLSIPGLLFHHMTPTKDYIHDWMKPWVHFVPVSSDLRDLKRKYDWAEAHPEESKKIADQSTQLMRYLTSPEGYRELCQRNLVEPLRRVIEAYQPISALHMTASWLNWTEALHEIEGHDSTITVIKCSGMSAKYGCTEYGRDWMKQMLTRRMKTHVNGG